jgi:hypothetical protein
VRSTRALPPAQTKSQEIQCDGCLACFHAACPDSCLGKIGMFASIAGVEFRSCARLNSNPHHASGVREVLARHLQQLHQRTALHPYRKISSQNLAIRISPAPVATASWRTFSLSLSWQMNVCTEQLHTTMKTRWQNCDDIVALSSGFAPL